MDLLKIVYPSLIELIGLKVTSDGFVRVELAPGDYAPATVDTRTLVLPLDEQLTSKDNDTKIIFHPLRENSLEGENSVETFYRHALINVLNHKIAALGKDLLTLAGDEARHPHLRPDQQAFLRLVPAVDKRTLEDFSAICKATQRPKQLHDKFITLRVTKGIPLNGKSYQCVAQASFPFYDALVDMEQATADAKAHGAKKSAKEKEKDKEVFGVGIRIKDREIFKGIMQYMIPEVDNAAAHSHGSNSNIAARMDSMMRTFIKTAGHYNAICDLFKDVIDGIEESKFNSDWVEGLNNLDELWTQIRIIPRASGVVSNTQVAAPAPAQTPAQQTAPTAAQLMAGGQTVYQQQQKPAPWEAAPPPYQQYPGGQQYQQPYQQPAQYLPPQQQSSGAPSFSDLMRGNPQLAQSVAQVMSPAQGYPQQASPYSAGQGQSYSGNGRRTY